MPDHQQLSLGLPRPPVDTDTPLIPVQMVNELSRFFDNSAEFWMGLQNQYDLEREQDRLADRLD